MASSDEAACAGGLDHASRFFVYNAAFDAQALIRSHARDPSPHPAYYTNFLGVRIDPKFLPETLGGHEGEIEPVPIPANWHADIAEWAAALRAVDLARETFTVAEVGCGWGCWINNTGVAARAAGLDVRLIGVEADPTHLSFAYEACAANGFGEEQLDLRHGVAAVRSGVALFPRHDATATEHWGLEPIFGASRRMRASAARSGGFDEVAMIQLGEILREYGQVDLVHMDIQGGEAELVEGARTTLSTSVAYLVVGTHSREIEGRLFRTLIDEGWLLEIERPAILALGGPEPTVAVDGVQGWRNLQLRPRS